MGNSFASGNDERGSSAVALAYVIRIRRAADKTGRRRITAMRRAIGAFVEPFGPILPIYRA
jgi:hypothetical protein